jgi:hypothetical protein
MIQQRFFNSPTWATDVTARQTDWSDGPGAEGPVLDWEARSAHDPRQMGPWVPVAPGPGCPGLLSGARYLQYRVLLKKVKKEKGARHAIPRHSS